MNINDKFSLEGVVYLLTLASDVVDIHTADGAAVLSGAKFEPKTRAVSGGTWAAAVDAGQQRALYRWASNTIRARTGGTLMG